MKRYGLCREIKYSTFLIQFKSEIQHVHITITNEDEILTAYNFSSFRVNAHGYSKNIRTFNYYAKEFCPQGR